MQAKNYSKGQLRQKPFNTIIGMALVMLFCLTLATSAYALTPLFNSNDYNASNFSSDALMAYNKLIDNQSKLKDMNERGIGTARVADEIITALQFFENAYAKQQQGAFADYSKSLAQSNQTTDLIQRAFGMQDELVALKEEIDAQEGQIDTVPARELYAKAEQEFNDQRFERVLEYVDQAYAKISELQSVEAKSTAMFTASQKTLEEFVKQNWAILAVVIGVPVILYIIFRKKIQILIRKRKIAVNEMEIEVLKNEIKNTQSQYFIKGNMAEGTYQIRTRIYGDKIRELNKQNAIYAEKLSELGNVPESQPKKFAAPEIKKNKGKKA